LPSFPIQAAAPAGTPMRVARRGDRGAGVCSRRGAAEDGDAMPSTRGATPNRLAYQPALDGVRARFAHLGQRCAAVVAAHLGQPGMGAGQQAQPLGVTAGLLLQPFELGEQALEQVFLHHQPARQVGNGVGVAGTTVGGTGVMGTATSTSAASYGVSGQSASSTGTGVYGAATSTTGKNYGVYGQSTSDSSSAIYGVNTNASATAYAGNFKGKVNVSGDITKTYSATSPTAERRAVPICYGTVNANGTIASGTPNFSAAWTAGGDYVIQIEGENYNGTSYTTVVTPISTVPLIGTTYAISNAFLGVRIFNLSSTAIQNGFSFIVYKP